MYGGNYGADPVSTFATALVGGGILTIAFILVSLAAYWLFFYSLIKAAVRNGMIEAAKKTGGSIGGGSGYTVSGYPPPQEYGPPTAPAYRE